MLYATTDIGKICASDYQRNIHGVPKCPCCEGKLVSKRGNIKAPHFAHARNSDCEHWTEPTTEWHLNWQLLAPPECREVRISKDGKLHIADIQLPDGHVIEVQHSDMKPQMIQAREAFYSDMTWIVDGRDVFSIIGMYHDVVVGYVLKNKGWWGHTTKPLVVDTECGVVSLAPQHRTMRKGERWRGKIVSDKSVPRPVYDWLLRGHHPFRYPNEVKTILLNQRFHADQESYVYSSANCHGIDNIAAHDIVRLTHRKVVRDLPDDRSICTPWTGYRELTERECEDIKQRFYDEGEDTECNTCLGCVYYTLPLPLV